MKSTSPAILILLAMLATACTPAPPITTDHPTDSLNVSRGEIHTHFNGDPAPLSQQAVDDWINTAARAVTAYFGRFPVKHLDLTVTFGDRDKISGGVTYGGRRISIHIGQKTRPADLASDWMLTHEMFHLAFPDLDKKHLWMNEGLSTYLEPIARARIGNMKPEQFSRETIEGMPQGLPEAGDQGLDHTHTWGRTYWGGAMFWLLADVQIREKTQNKKSLDDSIRADSRSRRRWIGRLAGRQSDRSRRPKQRNDRSQIPVRRDGRPPCQP